MIGEYLCMALDCKEKVIRDSFNFGDGFCTSCKEQKNANWREQFLSTND